MPREHLEVLLARVGALAEGEPLGEHAVVVPHAGRGRQPDEGFSFQVVLEDELLVARERAVRKPQDVVAVDQIVEHLADAHHVFCLATTSQTAGGDRDCRRMATSPPSQNTPLPIAAARSRSSRSS